LREGLRFYRDASTPGVVIVHDASRNSRLQLYEVECLIAKQMDGTKDLEAITRAAKPHVPWATRAHIEKLAVQIAGMGLLSNVTPPAIAKGTPPPMTAPLSNVEANVPRLDAQELLEEDEDAYGRTVLETVKPETDPFDHTALESREPPAFAPTVVEPMLASIPTSPPSPPPLPQRPSGPIPVPVPVPEPEPAPLLESQPEPVPEPEPEPVIPALEAKPAAEPPAAEPWVVEKTPWRKRKWVRRLMYLSIPAVIIAVLGVIPYPLYVTEPCTVVPSKRVHVRAPIDGLIAEIYVNEGDFVEQGTILARLDDRTVSFELQKAEAELQSLKLNLDKKKTGSRPEEVRKAEAHVSTASKDVHFARKKLQRAIELQRNGVGSVEERDEAQRDLALKQSLLAEAVAELRLVRAGSRSEEVAIAESEVRRAEAEVAHFRRHLDSLVIKSPIAGRVLTPRFRERLHEKLKEGDLVAEIGDVRVMRVEIEVPERDADVLQVGLPVTLKVHSLPLQAFTGKVSFIAPAVEETKAGGRILRVDAEVQNDQGLLHPGMTGYAEIDAGERTVLGRMTRRVVRWIRVRFLL
jgi:multidrug efflux pump subunit AcrA (membrane-fusion protein)